MELFMNHDLNDVGLTHTFSLSKTKLLADV